MTTPIVQPEPPPAPRPAPPTRIVDPQAPAPAECPTCLTGAASSDPSEEE